MQISQYAVIVRQTSELKTACWNMWLSWIIISIHELTSHFDIVQSYFIHLFCDSQSTLSLFLLFFLSLVIHSTTPCHLCYCSLYSHCFCPRSWTLCWCDGSISISCLFMCPLLRERCERWYSMGLVLSLCELRPETSPAQEVLPDAGRPGLPHFCLWSVLLYLVLHHHSRRSGTHCTKQGTVSTD